VPGHHLQISLSQESRDIPTIRKIGFFSAYSEGWALYAESLGFEMGFYTDPYMRFGALSSEMLRACRLVIDTGLHSKGWTREESIRYLMDNAGSNEPYAIAEVDRYVVWSGQALGYKIGQLKFRELRERARQQLGAQFDVKEFHDVALRNGPLPMTVLEREVDAWLAEKKAAPVTKADR